MEPEQIFDSKAEAQWAHLFSDHGKYNQVDVGKSRGSRTAMERPPIEQKPMRGQVEIDLAQVFDVPVDEAIKSVAEIERLV